MLFGLDTANRIAVEYGAAAPGTARPERATYIIDPAGKVVFVMKVARNVGRGVDETLRVLQALQTGRLCPADWRPGQPTYEAPAVDESTRPETVR